MALSGYTKLFSSIVTSTIWRASKDTKIVFVTMLALADKNGVVEGSIPGLADLARVSIYECEQALNELASPDTYSRTKEHEGRRIEPIDGGWILLNHPKYRNMLNADERREYLRRKKAESRARNQTKQDASQQSVNNGQQMSTPSTHTDPTTYTKATTEVRTIDRSTSYTGTDLLLSTTTEKNADAVNPIPPPIHRGHARGPSEAGSLPKDHMHCVVCSTTNRDLCIQYKLYDALSQIYNGADDDVTKTAITGWLREFEKPFVRGGKSPGGFTWMVKEFRSWVTSQGRVPEVSKAVKKFKTADEIKADLRDLRAKGKIK